MKKILFILTLSFTYAGFAQVFISNADELHIADNIPLYTNEDVVNEGTISFAAGKEIDFMLDAGFDNSLGTLNFNDATLIIGSGTANANTTDSFLFNTNDNIKHVVLNKNSGVVNVTAGHLGISETIKLESGNLTAGDNITLLNPSINDVAQVLPSTGGTANLRVERFIPVASALPISTRGFRFLTSAVNSNGSIYDNWQEGGNSPDGFGTHITGNNDGTNGVDQTISGNPSMYTFDNTSADGDGNQGNDWEAVTDTKGNNLIASKAYRIFIRGDRNYNLASDPADVPNSDVTLRATGNLIIGNYTHTLSDVAGYYSLVGNPYQAVVDFNNLTTTNVKTSNYYVWDPNISPLGAYVTHNLTLGTNNLTSATNEFIMPGQSFFVQTNSSAAASLEFTEASKDVTAGQTTVFSDDIDPSYMNLLLYKDQNLNNGGSASDGVLMIFDPNGNDAVDEKDAGKLGNPGENLARLNNGQYLSVDDRSLPSDMEGLELYTANYSVTDYTFSLDTNNISDDVDVYLIDNHTGDETLMSASSNQYSFSVDASIPESIATDRFSIQFGIETFGIDDNELAEFKVYPNPVTDGQLTITSTQMAGDDVELNLYNMIGQSLLRTKGTFESNGELKLNLGSYQAGVYFIEVSNNGETAKERLIIK